MMNFRVVNGAITTIIGAAAAGRFKVVGYQGQGVAASEILNNNRSVQSFYSEGEFSKSSGRYTGPTQHAMNFSIGLSVSAKAKINLSAINAAPAPTAGQLAAALDALQEASYVAGTLFDELAEYIYQILMDGRNIDLGLAKGTISSRWVGSIKKDSPESQGELVVLTGTIQYSCNTVEEVIGDTGVLGVGGVGTQLDIYADDVERTGILVNDDRTAPVISAFTMPETSDSLTVPVEAFTVTDNRAVVGYAITLTDTPPVAWVATPPTTATATEAGEITFYAWARDAIGNVSAPVTETVTINI